METAHVPSSGPIQRMLGRKIENMNGYKNIKPFELNEIIKSKNALLVDVYVPEQRHIPGTDLFVPFDKIKSNREKFPKDKNAHIVVYCRSGNKSKIASSALSEIGYKNVYNLEGGISGWERHENRINQNVSGYNSNKSAKFSAWIWGAVSGALMLAFYFAIMFITMTPNEVWFNFSRTWYLILGIIAGFGIQIGLWMYMKKRGTSAHGGVAGAGGAMSGTAMVACCIHHLADALPILGISGIAIFLTQYQKPFLVLGLSINILGIAYMLQLMYKHKYSNNENAYEQQPKTN